MRYAPAVAPIFSFSEMYAYFIEFTMPGSTQRRVWKSFAGFGAVEPASQQDPILILYAGPAEPLDGILDRISENEPMSTREDEQGTIHRLWKIGDAQDISNVQGELAQRKFLIVNGESRCGG